MFFSSRIYFVVVMIRTLQIDNSETLSQVIGTMQFIDHVEAMLQTLCVKGVYMSKWTYSFISVHVSSRHKGTNEERL